MKILNISKILPIPGISNSNNFVFNSMDQYNKLFPEDSTFFFRPVPYTNKLLSKYVQKSRTPLPQNFTEYNYNDHKVKTLKFISAWSINNLHAILSHSIYWINHKYIDRFIKKEKISVIHAQYIYPDGLLALILNKRFNIPYIITTHQELKYFNSFLSRKIAISILKNANKIIPLNFKNYNYFTSLGLKNMEVIPLGFDNSFLVRNPHNSNPDEFRIISVCELIKLKNIDKVLFSISILRNRFNIRYSIVGRGDESEYLKQLTDHLGLSDIVDFYGYTENYKLPEILGQHDLFVLPSYPETFGRVYFEAMAAGLPVICSKNSGIFGYFPYLVDSHAIDPDNPDELAKKIEFFIENEEKRKETGKTLQSLVSDFTWDNIAKKYEKLYHKAHQYSNLSNQL